jgi:hypothetical protein
MRRQAGQWRQGGGVLGVLLWIIVAIFVIGLLVVLGAGALIF